MDEQSWQLKAATTDISPSEIATKMESNKFENPFLPDSELAKKAERSESKDGTKIDQIDG